MDFFFLQQDLSSPPVFHLLIREGGVRSPSCCPVGKEGGCTKSLSSPSTPSSVPLPPPAAATNAAGPVPSPFSLRGGAANSIPSSPATPNPTVAHHATVSTPPVAAAVADGTTVLPTRPPEFALPWPVAASPPYSPIAPAAWGFQIPAASPSAAMPLGAAAAAACYEQLHRVYYETYYQAYMAAL